MQALLNIVEQLSAWITGPMGIAVITLALGIIAALVALEMMAWRHVWKAGIAGAIVFAAAAIVTTLHG